MRPGSLVCSGYEGSPAFPKITAGGISSSMSRRYRGDLEVNGIAALAGMYWACHLSHFMLRHSQQLVISDTRLESTMEEIPRFACYRICTP